MTDMQLLPVISEKAMEQADEKRTYTFLVPKAANKIEIGRAVAETYSVKTQTVNTTVIKGKPRQTFVQRGKRRIKGSRSDFKKAFVTLAEGQKIQLLEEKKS